MKFIFFIASFILFGTQATGQDSLKNIKLTISLFKNTFNNKDDILIKIVLTNNSKKNQKLLFDKPKPSTGGPWWTSASLINVNTGKSVLKYGSKAVLSSQIYSDDQLKDKYYQLKPRQSLQGTFSLFDIVVTTFNRYYGLDVGTYEVQLFYSSKIGNMSLSNKLILIVK